jgi:hypothetical protein
MKRSVESVDDIHRIADMCIVHIAVHRLLIHLMCSIKLRAFPRPFPLCPREAELLNQEPIFVAPISVATMTEGNYRTAVAYRLKILLQGAEVRIQPSHSAIKR